ncbi:MAG: glycosyltransferase family 2 protein, partial [Pseudomonadota bacterium]
MTAKYPLLTFTVMKNEGPFILEWIAYQKVFGADKILVMTNNCDDGTDLLLDRLDEMGLVRHVPNPSGMGTKYVGKANHPHIVGMTYAKLHREWREAERVLMCDVDEFPIVYVGDGSFDALMDAA